MSDTEWTSPLMDYYMDQSDGIEACEKHLYLAVIKGQSRLISRGRATRVHVLSHSQYSPATPITPVAIAIQPFQAMK
jgi:hypothetical protein